MGTFSKFVRPETARPGVITDRDLDIIEAVLRYRFSPASELVRLVGGNEDVTQRRLRRLWETGLVNRFAFPGIRTHSEFYYYLDSREPLDLLAERRGVEIRQEMLDEIRSNREKDYAQAAYRGQHMQLGFLKHSLMISRFHYMLDMGCQKSSGKAALYAWSQGSPLAGHKADVPKVKSTRQDGECFWQETDESERLPVEPDAMFSLRFANRPEGQQLAHFLYEADRGSMVMTDMFKKLRAYSHFIKKHQCHKEAFGVHPIRAVLIETTTESRAKRLMDLARHPLVSGPKNRAGLFWCTISPMFTDVSPSAKVQRPFSRYLDEPQLVLSAVWALPDRSLHALADSENASHDRFPV